MANLDFYWISNKEWVERDGFGYKVRDDAPPEAKESYERYLQQRKEASERNSI